MVTGTVRAIHACADLLGDAVHRIPGIDPGPTPFGVGGPGALGEIGREAYLHWQRGLDARGREAQAHAHAVLALGDLVHRATAGMVEANEGAAAAHRDAADGLDSTQSGVG